MQRVLSRKLCPVCNLDYNLIHHRPAVEDHCDVCGSELVSRPDDTEGVVRKRLEDYHAKTEPILALFSQKELVVTVNGGQSTEAVQAEIRMKMGTTLVTRKPGRTHS